MKLNKKEKLIAIRLTKEQLEKLEDYSKLLNLTLSELIRQLIDSLLKGEV